MPIQRYPTIPTPGNGSGNGNGSGSGHRPQQARGRTTISRPAGSSSGKTNLLPDVEVEDFGPPAWRTVFNARADLGYPDFYPSRPGFNQPEDVLTEENVKNGFTAKTFVAPTAESFSMHGPIHQHLLNGGLERLNKLGEDLLAKRESMLPVVGDRAFRIPVRVTYNDTKRLQFLSDLANPLVPLHRLMKNPVPHGFKGIELLDAMYSPVTTPSNRPATTPTTGVARPPADPIPLDRAIWFIRVLGANEISAHRTRAQPAAAAPSPIPATPSSTNTAAPTPPVPLSSNAWYTQEFTNTFTSWMRIQLVQLALPGKGRPGASRPAVGILGDEKARARWIAKWDYTTTLLRELHSKYLISPRILTGWLADHLSPANFAQIGFIGKLIGIHMSDMARHVVNGRYCLRAACEKIQELRVSPFAGSLKKIEETLCSIIKSLVSAQSEILLSPLTWRIHGPLLRSILDPSDLSLDEYHQRNTSILFKSNFANNTSSPRRLQMQEIQKLDSMSSETSMSDLAKSFFDGTSSPTSPALDHARFQDKVHILLSWAMSLFTLGVHRPYAVCTLLKLWHDERDAFVQKTSATGPIDMFPALYDWLESSPSAKDPANVLAIGITFGELTRSGLFSYGRYLQTLISHGHTARSGSRSSHHLGILRALPIFVEGKDLMHQRRIALCGDDQEQRTIDELQENQQMESYKEEVKEFVPEIFGYKRWGRSTSLRDSIDHQLLTAPEFNRYMFLQARFWLFPLCSQHLKAQPTIPAMNGSTFARLLLVFRQCYGLSTTADMTVRAILHAEDPEVVLMAMDTVVREADCWTANDRWGRITDALVERLHNVKPGDRLHGALITLLSELRQQGRLSSAERKDLKAAQEKAKEASLTGGHADAHISMPDVEQAIKRGDPESAASLGERMYTRHGPYLIWADLWWSTVVKAISATSNQASQGSLVDIAMAHISAVDRGGLDATVATWLDTLPPSSKVELLGQRSSPFLHTFLRMVTTRRLSSLTVLDKLVYPVWLSTATSCLSTRLRQSSRIQAAVENTVMLAHQLLVTVGPHKNLPPSNLEEVLVLQTARARVFHDTHVPSLIRHLPHLVVLQYSSAIWPKTNTQIGELLDSLAATAEFKTAAFRHLDLLKDAFLSSEWSKPSLESGLETGMVDTLKMIMSEHAGDSKSTPTLLPVDSVARFSAWRWTGIVLGLRVQFKALAGRIETGDRTVEAKETLSLLVRQSLERDTSADDADLLCEAFRGIEPIVIQEIISAGLDRLAALLGQMLSVETQHQLETIDKMVDLVLRIMTSSTGPPESIDLENGPTAARHRLLDVISLALQAVERQISADEEMPIEVDAPQPAVLLAIVIRLLKFSLGLGRSEVNMLTTPRADFGKLAMTFTRVIQALPKGVEMEPLQDTLAFIIDCAPPSTRASLFSTFLSELPALHTVLSAHPGLITALPHTSPPRRIMSLSNDTEVPLDDRPWELFEQLAPQSTKPRHVDMFLSNQPIRDTSSISMALFNPQLKRDGRPPQHGEWELYPAERNLGDGLTGEPMAAKQSATLLYSASTSILSDSVSSSAAPQASTPAKPSVSTPSEPSASSPIPAPARRSSIRKAGAGGGSSTKDPIPVDEDSSGDSDLEVVAVPPAKRPRKGSESKGRASTGGKAPAKKMMTTGGKGVARKATGGKNVGRKAPGGKAPKKR